MRKGTIKRKLIREKRKGRRHSGSLDELSSGDFLILGMIHKSFSPFSA
jgi:hypothetical protein